MCGIVGVYALTDKYSVTESLLIEMRDAMAHRGPDDAGVHVYRNNHVQVGFGHRRLSIIDLSPLGHQPMSTEDGRLWIVFNGEIFNYRELREQLVGEFGCRFRSESDTEVILYGIHHWGLEKCLGKIRGMYAFCIFDRADSSLTLVRDPLGVKPLYYCRDGKDILFASEIKSLLVHPAVGKAVDRESLWHYLTFANSPAPDTLFENIKKLEPAHYIKITADGNLVRTRYWSPDYYGPETAVHSEMEYVEEIQRLLRQSVSRRMVSDVPFGVFLSGGVDSSLNVALMAEQLDRPVETFSIGIEGDPSNEFEYARKVAQHFSTNHHEVVIGDDDFINFLSDMSWYQDEPLADPVCVPIYYVSKLARESGVPVIQVGEGSDEIFSGYGLYNKFNSWDRNWFSPYSKLPGMLREFVLSAARGRVASHMEDALRRAAVGEPLFIGNAVAFWDNEKAELFREPQGYGTSGHLISDLMRNGGLADGLSRIIDVELKNRLPELLLMRVDKMSMANSIETRVPFLDEDLVEYALRIPARLKYRKGISKYILKKSAEGILPDEIIYRKKWGFCGSATNMLSDRLVSYAHDRIMDSGLVRELFDREYIGKIIENHRNQKRFNSFKIWNLLNLAIWHDRWFTSG